MENVTLSSLVKQLYKSIGKEKKLLAFENLEMLPQKPPFLWVNEIMNKSYLKKKRKEKKRNCWYIPVNVFICI